MPSTPVVFISLILINILEAWAIQVVSNADGGGGCPIFQGI